MGKEPAKKEPEETTSETKPEKNSEKINDKLKEEANREAKKLKNVTAKTEEARVQYEKIALFTILTAVGTVLFGMGVQYFYNKLVIEPQLERTFPHYQPIYFEKNVHVVFNQSSILHLVNLNDSTVVASLSIQQSENGTSFSLKDLDWYQLNDGDGKNFARLQYQYKNLIVTVRYVANEDHLIFTFDAIGYDQNRATAKHSIVIFGGNGVTRTVDLFDSSQEAFIFPVVDSESSTSYEVYNNISLESEANFRDKFDEVYKLKDKNLPIFYQEMGRVALTTVLHSLRFDNKLSLNGSKNGNFDLIQPHINLLTEHQKSMDLQVFSLITASFFDEELVKNAITSWLNTINSRNEIGNTLVENRVSLAPVQVPLFFQLVKGLLKNPAYSTFLEDNYSKFAYLAEETMKNSIETEEKVNYYKWKGQSSGLFGAQTKTDKKTSSLELICLLEDMYRVMNDLSEKIGKPNVFYSQQFTDLSQVRNLLWSTENSEYGDRLRGDWVSSSQSSHVPLILGLLESDSTQLSVLLSGLEENGLWSKAGIQQDTKSGANVAVNYLLLGALKKYSEKSGQMQHKAHVLYSIAKNNMIANIARGFKTQKTLFGSYDNEWNGLNPGESNDGTLILPIMAELFV